MEPDRMMGFYVLVIMHFVLVLLPLTLIARAGMVLDDITMLQVTMLLETLTIIIFTIGMIRVSQHQRNSAECWEYLLAGD